MLTEFVSAVVRSMSPNCSLPKLFSGAPETVCGLRPSSVEPGSNLPVSSAAAAVTAFIVEPGGKRPWVARLRLAPHCAVFGSKDGLAASTLTAPVFSSIATAAPCCGRPASARVATSCAFGSSVVRRSSPTFCGPKIESTALISSVRRPVSWSL